MQTGVLCGIPVAAERGANALDLVCGNGYPHASTTDENSLIRLAGSNLCTGSLSNVGIIHALAVAAAVDEFHALFRKVLYDLTLHRNI